MSKQEREQKRGGLFEGIDPDPIRDELEELVQMLLRVREQLSTTPSVWEEIRETWEALRAIFKR